MTTGAPIFLVSACASGEEFVAAFRRYADRNGLFIPIAAPIPAGRRGRFAVTLADGGVMIEGDADIVSSATTPSVLHGRVGMTLRFVEPDIKSKTVLVELEQARLAMKPQPPSVPPRPAQVPPEPRPKVPAITGRIDRNNALAECVAIGDIDALETTVPQVKSGGPRFVVPTIPPVAGGRPKAPSTPPMGYPPVAKPATTPPPVRAHTPSTPPAVPPKPLARPTGTQPPATKPALPSLPRTSTIQGATPLAPPSTAQSGPTLVAPPIAPTGPLATVEAPLDDELAAEDASRDTIAMPAIVPAEALASLTRSRSPSDEVTAASVIDAVPEAVPEDPPSISRPNPTGSGKVALPPPRRGNTQPPPIPKTATPSAPMPAVTAKPTLSGFAPVRAPTQLGLPIVQSRRPAKPSGEIPLPPVVAEARAKPTAEVADEPTDIMGVPVVAPAEESSGSEPHVPGTARKTVMGVAVVPDGMTVLPASPSSPVASPTEEVEVPPAPAEEPVVQAEVEPYLAAAITSAKQATNLDDAAAEEPTAKPTDITARPPVIEEPSGDWTMIPGADGPTILPRVPEGMAGEKLPAGDWTIARSDASPDGWGEPAKVDLAALRPNLRSNTGPPVAMVAGEKPLEVTMTAKAFDIEEETKSGLKVEVDSSLAIVPDRDPVMPPARSTASIDIAMQSTQYVPPMPTPPPGSLPGAPVRVLDPSKMPRSRGTSSGSYADYPTSSNAVGDSTSMIDTGKKKRVLIIAASAGLAIVVGVVLLIVFGLGGDSSNKSTQSPAVAAVPPDVAPLAGTPADAAEPIVEIDASTAVVPQPSADCFVEVSSTPAGAEIVHDDTVLGVTPTKLTLPCGAETKMLVRKAKFASSTRAVTPTAEGAKLKVTLGKTLYAVKVTSSPPGATITIAGKSAGVTPAMVKLPAGESTQLTIAKAGFNPDTPKITPKQNNQSVHVNLKKKGR